jgi:hypothetical protein
MQGLKNAIFTLVLPGGEVALMLDTLAGSVLL